MRRLLLLLVLAAGVAAYCPARKMKSGPSRLRRPTSAVELFDTIVPPRGLIACSGYDKPNGATRETFFLTNNDSIDAEAVNLTIEYYDMKGRLLHSATHTVRTTIPAGETRNVGVGSWDRNNSFHYFRSAAPKRRASTPYGVKARVNDILRLRSGE